MNITRYTDYSLRTLIFLATHPERLVTINDIAEGFGISRNHLMKVVQELSAREYVYAQRGKHGGIRLNRPADEINIGEVVRVLENRTALVECFAATNHCVITPVCKLKGAFASATEQFFKVLDSYVLADLVDDSNRSDLIQILRMEP